MSKKEIITTSEIGWVSKQKLIITLQNNFYLVNLEHEDLIQIKNGIAYGRQQVNMGLFTSIVTRFDVK